MQILYIIKLLCELLFCSQVLSESIHKQNIYSDYCTRSRFFAATRSIKVNNNKHTATLNINYVHLKVSN